MNEKNMRMESHFYMPKILFSPHRPACFGFCVFMQYTVPACLNTLAHLIKEVGCRHCVVLVQTLI